MWFNWNWMLFVRKGFCLAITQTWRIRAHNKVMNKVTASGVIFFLGLVVCAKKMQIWDFFLLQLSDFFQVMFKGSDFCTLVCFTCIHTGWLSVICIPCHECLSLSGSPWCLVNLRRTNFVATSCVSSLYSWNKPQRTSWVPHKNIFYWLNKTWTA